MNARDAKKLTTFDQRDTLILALSSLLRAERQTRLAFEACLSAGVLNPEVLEAIVSDPIPVVTQEDINYAGSVATNANNAGGCS